MGYLEKINLSFVTGDSPVKIFFRESKDAKIIKSKKHHDSFLKESSLPKLLKALYKNGCPIIKKHVAACVQPSKNDHNADIVRFIKECITGNYDTGGDISIRFINIDNGIKIDIMSIECDIMTEFKYVDNINENIIDLCGIAIQTIYGEIQV